MTAIRIAGSSEAAETCMAAAYIRIESFQLRASRVDCSVRSHQHSLGSLEAVNAIVAVQTILSDRLLHASKLSLQLLLLIAQTAPLLGRVSLAPESSAPHNSSARPCPVFCLTSTSLSAVVASVATAFVPARSVCSVPSHILHGVVSSSHCYPASYKPTQPHITAGSRLRCSGRRGCGGRLLEADVRCKAA